MKKISVETKAVYVGGSIDGQLVKPSLGNEAIKRNLPIISTHDYLDADYPMAINEYYYPEESNGKIVFKLGKTEQRELVEI